MDGLVSVVADIMKQSKVEPKQVIAIGIDFTSSTVLPVKVYCPNQENVEAYNELYEEYITLLNTSVRALMM